MNTTSRVRRGRALGDGSSRKRHTRSEQTLSETDLDFVQGVLSLDMPIRLDVPEQQRQLWTHITPRDYLSALVKKLYPVLSRNGVRLAGGCAAELVRLREETRRMPELSQEQEQQRGAAVLDIDINIYVTDAADFRRILEYEEIVLRKLLFKRLGLALDNLDVFQRCLLDSVRVRNDKDNWSLISFGNLDCAEQPQLQLDIKVINRISRLYVFASDSFEVLIDPLFVKGESGEPIVLSRWGPYKAAAAHLLAKRLVVDAPETIRRGLLRYCLAQCRGFSIEDTKERRAIEALMVENFWKEFVSQEAMATSVRKMVRKHGRDDPGFASCFVRKLGDVLQRYTPFLFNAPFQDYFRQT